MRYFIPEWDDRVDPNYDFLNDKHKKDRDTLEDIYAHEIYGKPNYDGVLVSKIKIEENKTKRKRIQKLGVHKFFRLPANFPVMGDCGAFGYINQENPPYETEEILNYYDEFGFNYGVAIDHLIVPGVFKKKNYLKIVNGEEYKLTEEEYKKLKQEYKSGSDNYILKEVEYIDEKEIKRRFELTLNNAKDFIEKHRKRGCKFIPIGSAQGLSPQSYQTAVSELIKMGYKFIAIGGIARSQTKEILEILKEVKKVLIPGIQIHLFGVARLEYITTFRELGVTSFDSASFLRRAWLGISHNYFTENGNYSAIRLPQSDKSPRTRKIIKSGKATLEEIQKLEKRSLENLRAYARRELDIDKTLESILKYDALLGENREEYPKYFRKTLEDRPWEKCTCKICKELGVEVVIFRGNNRNRRRGFHNTYVFYKLFKEVLKNPEFMQDKKELLEQLSWDIE